MPGLSLPDVLRANAGATWQTGTVIVAAGTGVVVVSVGGSELTLPHLRGYAPAVNDAVLVLQQGGRRVVVDAFTNPADPIAPRNSGAPAPAPTQPKPKPPAPKPTVVTGVKSFAATATGCFRGGKWRTDTSQPHQGDWGGAYGRNTGAWFYGTQIKTSLAGATVTKAEMYMVRLSGGVYGGVSPTVFTTPHPSRPAGAPTLQGGGSVLTAQSVSTRRWVSLPTALAQAMVAGTAYGLACFVNADDPYGVYASLADSRSSGLLRITYRKG
jgi:hypothetical protein